MTSEDTEDPVLALAARFDALELKVLGVLGELTKQVASVVTTGNQTYILVNGRMTQLTNALEKVAKLGSQLAGEEGEKRGAAHERERAAEEKDG